MFAARFSAKAVVADMSKDKNATSKCSEHRLKTMGEFLKIRKGRQIMPAMAGITPKENTAKKKPNSYNSKDN